MKQMVRIFVYGIFLDESMRQQYDMWNPEYATVKGYATTGVTRRGTIVGAVRVQDEFFLTGLTVQMPDDLLGELDMLESGYERIKVKTTDGRRCWMYTR